MVYLLMGERRGLNPRVVDSQSTALIHLATSAPTPAQVFQSRDTIRSLHPMTAIKEKLFPIRELQVYSCVLELGEAKLQQVGRFLAKLQRTEVRL
ncbi:hypothetical protein SDJN03_18660, partial [Cucurbita argyrosperma subsp. sororia]